MAPSVHDLPPDTQAVLLLCGHFPHAAPAVSRPLVPSEYHDLARWLHSEHRRPSDLLSADANALLLRFNHARIESERVLALLDRTLAMALSVGEWMRKGIWILSRADEAYPHRFKTRLGASTPPLLFGAGERELLSGRFLGMVGSRRIDPGTRTFCRELAAAAVREGLTIVSGGAEGVDEESVGSALASDGFAVVFPAEGVDRPAAFPSNRQAIRDNHLTLLSPFVPGSRWTAGNAMARNKLIYCLSDWVVVSASNTDGGTWTGALDNLKHNWTPLWVRSGPDTPPGNARLIALGARDFGPELPSGPGALLTHLDRPTQPAPDLFSGLEPPTEGL